MNKKTSKLDKEEILKEVSFEYSEKFNVLKILDSTTSTNDVAKQGLKKYKNEKCILAYFAEEQTSGRGRSNKKWHSPYGKNIYFSLGWRSKLKVSQLEGFSLSVGVIISESLKKLISKKLKIKWPNDLYIDQKKIGGILIETSSSNDLLEVIIGIGINVFMSKNEGKNIDQEWSSLEISQEKNCYDRRDNVKR